MYIVKYSTLVHMAETHSQERPSPYELVPNISQYTFNNLLLLFFLVFAFLVSNKCRKFYFV